MPMIRPRITNRRLNQYGVFAVEFALVASIMAGLLVFSADMSIKLSMRGKLDRLSYSMANLIKERKELASNDFSLFSPSDTTSDFAPTKIFNMVRNSLYRTTSKDTFDPSKLVIQVEQLNTQNDGTIDDADYVQAIIAGSNAGSSPLAGKTPLKTFALKSTPTLSPLTVYNRRAILYQVNICYKTENWYGEFVDNLHGSTSVPFEWVCSNSVSIAR